MSTRDTTCDVCEREATHITATWRACHEHQVDASSAAIAAAAARAASAIEDQPSGNTANHPTWCSLCGPVSNPAEFDIFAAYDDRPAEVHHVLARYPSAMASACGLHIGEVMRRDLALPGATGLYVVKPRPA